jgi:MYXO-CTERM domain-containing protein
VQGQSLLVWGGSGTLLPGSMGELGLTGTMNVAGGGAQQIGDGAITVALHNPNAANGLIAPGGATDFVSVGTGAGQLGVLVASPANGFTIYSYFFGFWNGGEVGEYLAEQNIGGNLNYSFFAISASLPNAVNLPAGQNITSTVSATLISDPGMTIDYDSSQLPSADSSDDDGFDDGAPVLLPEPALLAPAGLLALTLIRRRRAE